MNLRKLHEFALVNATRALVLISLLVLAAPAPADSRNLQEPKSSAVTVQERQDVAGNLASILQSIETKRSAIGELRKQLRNSEEPSERLEIEQKIDQHRRDVQALQHSFEEVVLGGINLSILTDEADRQMDWRLELEEIVRPLLATLKELTEKPRQVDSLRRKIGQQEDRLQLITRAIDSIQTVRNMPATPAVSALLEQLQAEWEQRREDTRRELEIANFRLDNLQSGRVPWQTTISQALHDFLRGRGLTLLLAVIAGLSIWVLSRGLLALYWRWVYRSRSDTGVTRAPLVLYAYRLAVAVLIVTAIMLVLYVRGDVLLLTLAVLALAGVALSLRQTLPRYTAELRLLLGVGPVRELERLVIDGIPYHVESLGIYTVLRNPALEGVLRLPLQDINTLASRPAGTEPWFPCQPGDYLLLADGNYGQVLRQTIEMVELAVRDATVRISTKDFLGQTHRNLSRDGFGIACTFGIDYRHQAICLDEVPRLLRDAIRSQFKQSGLANAIREMLVEFREAGSSSLDYQIYLILDGQAAQAFFRSQRLVQQACVACCNREGWVIPFTQVTIHTADSP